MVLIKENLKRIASTIQYRDSKLYVRRCTIDLEYKDKGKKLKIVRTHNDVEVIKKRERDI